MKATALVMTSPRAIELQSYELPPLLPDEVLVRTECSGVSQGTEIHTFRGTLPNVAFPTVTGYQSVGIIEDVGVRVEGFEIGDRVLFTTSRLPEHIPPTWMGSHVSRALVSTRVRPPIRVPEGVATVDAALTAVVAVGLGGIQQIDVGLDDVVLVSGQGMIGQCAAQLARARGATVVTTDMSPARVAMSASHSADIALNAGIDDVDAVLRSLRPGGIDVVIETTGRADQIASCIERLRTTGTVLLQGYYPLHIDIDFHPTHIKKPTIAVACGFGDLTLALSLLRWGKVNVGGLVTHLAPATDGPELFRRMEQGDGDVMAVVFDWATLDGPNENKGSNP